MFWGLCEAIDLFGEYLRTQEDRERNPPTYTGNEATANISCGPENKTEREVNILIFGSSDPRHMMKTMAKIYTHIAKGLRPTINLYVIDGCIEIVARNIALLGIALENPNLINLHSKVHLFMDVYGNSLIRAFSHQYMVAKTKSLLKIVTDDECLARLAPFLNIEGLKYRERDGLENTLNFWLPKDEHVFNIKKYWCDRVRHHLGTRYDYREGQFDWDLNMVLKERGGSQICSQEYRHWRETGIAFAFPEFEYSMPNKTLSAGLVRNGGKYAHRGYVGDIQTGPFMAFGLTTSDQRMLKSAHGVNDYRSTDVTERNILEIFHELATHTTYEHNLELSRKYGCVRLQMSKNLTNTESDVVNTKDYDEPWINVVGVKINFLSCDNICTLQSGHDRWTNFFDVIFVGHNYFPFLKDTFTNLLSPRSLLILETKLMTTGTKRTVESFEQELFNFAKRTNLREALNYESLNSKRFFLKFIKN